MYDPRIGTISTCCRQHPSRDLLAVGSSGSLYLFAGGAELASTVMAGQRHREREEGGACGAASSSADAHGDYFERFGAPPELLNVLALGSAGNARPKKKKATIATESAGPSKATAARAQAKGAEGSGAAGGGAGGKPTSSAGGAVKRKRQGPVLKASAPALPGVTPAGSRHDRGKATRLLKEVPTAAGEQEGFLDEGPSDDESEDDDDDDDDFQPGRRPN